MKLACFFVIAVSPTYASLSSRNSFTGGKYQAKIFNHTWSIPAWSVRYSSDKSRGKERVTCLFVVSWCMVPFVDLRLLLIKG